MPRFTLVFCALALFSAVGSAQPARTAPTAPATDVPESPKVDSARLEAPAQGADTLPVPAPEALDAPADPASAPDGSGSAPSPGASSAPSPALPPAAAADAATAPVGPEDDLRLFNDYPLMGRQYLFGMVGAGVTGMIGFYVAKAFEGLFREHESDVTGHLSFTGVRYDPFSGAFWGGASGLAIGSAIGAFWTGSADEEDGSFFWTVLGGGAATSGAIGLAHLLGSQEEHDWPALVPLLTLPPAGAVLGFQVSRYFRDQRRERLTRDVQVSAPPVQILDPRVEARPVRTPEGQLALDYRLDMLRLRF